MKRHLATRPSTRRLTASAFALALALSGPCAMAQATSFSSAFALAQSGDVSGLETLLPGLSDPAEIALVKARLAQAQLDNDEVTRQLAQFAATGDADPDHVKQATLIRLRTAASAGHYGVAAKACAQVFAAGKLNDGDDVPGLRENCGIMTVLADAPEQTMVSYAPHAQATRRTQFGQLETDLTINGLAQTAMLDTGANLSVATQTTAKKLGLHMIAGDAAMSSTTRSALDIQLATADQLEIGGVILHKVVFMVVDDDTLKLPVPGAPMQIEAIIGFPVFQAMERTRFSRDGFITPLRSPSAGSGLHNMIARDNDLFVKVTVDGQPACLHLDLGANVSNLFGRFAAAHPDLVAGLQKKTITTVSAGGASANTVAIWPSVPIGIAGQTVTVSNMSIQLDASPTDNKTGVIGQDVLGTFAAYDLDLKAMSFEVTPAVQ